MFGSNELNGQFISMPLRIKGWRMTKDMGKLEAEDRTYVFQAFRASVVLDFE
jgi:hypothetical protein